MPKFLNNFYNNRSIYFQGILRKLILYAKVNTKYCKSFNFDSELIFKGLNLKLFSYNEMSFTCSVIYYFLLKNGETIKTK